MILKFPFTPPCGSAAIYIFNHKYLIRMKKY